MHEPVAFSLRCCWTRSCRCQYPLASTSSHPRRSGAEQDYLQHEIATASLDLRYLLHSVALAPCPPERARPRIAAPLHHSLSLPRPRCPGLVIRAAYHGRTLHGNGDGVQARASSSPSSTTHGPPALLIEQGEGVSRLLSNH